MRIARFLTIAAVLACAMHVLVAAPAKVRVWQDTITLPTSVEDAPNPNAPFDLFSFGRFNYPYPLRDALTDRREPVAWRALHLENEYLRVTVLPDLGGHLYSCLDKRTGHEMFYANSAIKKALIGYRGAWAAFGIEFNFPVSHNWMSMSPVDFAEAENPDGSGSIWVGNKDQVYGSHWRVELRLEPARAVLDQRTTLSNVSDVRHRYYWWNNAAVQVWEDSRLVYPTELMATHGFTAVEPWPVDRQGRDLSVIRNQLDGPVSLFTYQTREGFVGVYHPHTQSGTVHVAPPSELPVHKVWSWGYDRDAASWRTALSDDDSAYVELQSGLFRNQETYAFLEPQETVRFSEHWLPVRDLGGITRASVDGVVFMERPSPGHLKVALDVTRDIPDAKITIRQDRTVLAEKAAALSPRDVWRGEYDLRGASPVTFELTASGTPVLVHTEGVFDRTPASSVRVGPRTSEPVSTESADGVAESGTVDELEGRRLVAMAKYQDGLGRFPRSLPLLKAAGRLALTLGWVEANPDKSPGPIDWLQTAAARNTTDFETQYYLGLALAAAGRERDARPHLEAAQRFRATRTAASLQLARLASRQGDANAALEQLRLARDESSPAALPEALEITMLRRLRRNDEARTRAQQWLTRDPASSLVRYERVRLGDADPALWLHLGGDANRVLDLVDQYFAIGAYDDAVDLLTHEYPAVDPPMREPGAVVPRDSPLVAYYRGYARAQTGSPAVADYTAAGRMPTAYVFPSRRSSFAVLLDALRVNPEDATARFLLGSLYLSSGLVDPAIDAWQHARRSRAPIPTLHRNLGLALLSGRRDYTEARAVLEEGVSADPTNVEVYLTLDGVLSAAGAAPRERVEALKRYPSAKSMPSALVFKLALALAESGDGASAEQMFHGRFFPREEGGTNVRAVYVQTRLTTASLAARKGDCGNALGILDTLSREQKDLTFTAGGLADALDPAMMARQMAGIESACGRDGAARARWTKLDRPGGGPLGIAMADEAHRRLGLQAPPDRQQHLQEALDSATRTLASAGTSNPGSLEYARALLLNALGRTTEARESRSKVFVFPDRNLSHALARGMTAE